MQVFKKLLVVVTIFSTTTFASANTNDIANNENDKNNLMSKLKAIQHFSSNFTQKVLDNDKNIIQEGSGTLVVSKPDKVHWQTKSPEESLIVSDGTTLWLYDPFIEQVSAYSLVNAVANTPVLLITSEDKELWAQYTVQEINQDIFIVNSLDEQSQVTSLIISFEQQEISSLLILDATGQSSEIHLSSRNYKAQPDTSLFKFTVPQGVLLDDQR